MISQTPKKLSESLLEIAAKVVEKYEEHSQEVKDQDILLEKAREVLNEGMKEEFNTIWAETVMLVIAQFFENPYAEGSDGLKRPYSPTSEEDFDNDYYFSSSKKHHFCS